MNTFSLANEIIFQMPKVRVSSYHELMEYLKTEGYHVHGMTPESPPTLWKDQYQTGIQMYGKQLLFSGWQTTTASDHHSEERKNAQIQFDLTPMADTAIFKTMQERYKH